ncbi:MAG: DUF2283 domain-containing protein [Candidatus Shapirobacteria bacterium]
MGSKMKISNKSIKKAKRYYDPDSDVLWIITKSGEVEAVEELSPGINIEFDKNGLLLGIEVLNYSKQKQFVDYSFKAIKVKDSSRELSIFPDKYRSPIVRANNPSSYFSSL